MKISKAKFAILLLGALLISLVSIFFTREQIIKESIQVQILENVLKPLDLVFFHYSFLPNTLPTYAVTVTGKNLQKLYDSLPQTNIETEFNYKRIVEDRLYVPAKFTIGDIEYDAKLTVRGVNPPHYLGEKKSFRVRIDKRQNAPFSGLDFLVPEDRYFVDDIASYYISNRLDLFAHKPSFANLIVNGRHMGVYESLPDEEDDANIELATLSTTDIFFRDESKPQVLASHPRDSGHWANLFGEGGTWQIRNTPSDNDPSPYSPLEKLIEVNKKQGNEFFSELPQIVDTKKLIDFIAHNHLMGDWHQGNQHNQSLLFVKEMGKFWFVPNDNSINQIEVLDGFHFNDFTEKVIKNPKFYWARNAVLWELVNDNELKGGLILEMEKTYELLKGPIYQDNLKPFRFIAFRSKIKKQIETLSENFVKISSYFEPYYIDTSTQNFTTIGLARIANTRIRANAYFQPQLKSIKVSFSEATTTKLEIFYDINENKIVDDMDEPLASVNLLGETEYEIPVNMPLLAPRFLDSPVDVVRPTAISNILISSTNTTVTLEQIDYAFSNALTGDRLETQNNLLDESLFIQKPPLPSFVRVVDKDHSEIGPGTFEITDDLYFESGRLTISPGTTLKFGPGKSMIVRGVLIAKAPEGNPITFTRMGLENWGGILVVGPDNDVSEFENVTVEYGSGVSIYGLKSTGTLSLHFTNAIIKSSRFKMSQNDDSINIKHGHVQLTANDFRDSFADAIDVDVTTGEISNNTFSNIGTGPDFGDAIDTSFSNLEIKNNKVIGATDKCLSIGESSNLKVLANTFSYCDIAIAVKDDSKAEIFGNTLRSSRIGVSAYLKKPIYKKGGLAILKNNLFEKNKNNIEADQYSQIK